MRFAHKMLWGGVPIPYTNLLIKPASSLCNMRCRYCFYADEAANRELPCGCGRSPKRKKRAMQR